MPESARIGELARYFVANQPMRYGIEIVYSLEVEHCILHGELVHLQPLKVPEDYLILARGDVLPLHTVGFTNCRGMSIPKEH